MRALTGSSVGSGTSQWMEVPLGGSWSDANEKGNVPKHRWMLGLPWDGDVYIDVTLPFGLRLAPQLWEVRSQATLVRVAAPLYQ